MWVLDNINIECITKYENRHLFEWFVLDVLSNAVLYY